MSKMFIKYNGELRTKLVHIDSNSSIQTDAPKDNNGLGETFSPTDLTASSLAACMMTIIGIQNKKHTWGIQNMEAEIEKIMASNPRRISEIHVKMTINALEVDDKSKDLIRKFAESCPVAQSLNTQIIQNLKIVFT